MRLSFASLPGVGNAHYGSPTLTLPSLGLRQRNFLVSRAALPGASEGYRGLKRREHYLAKNARLEHQNPRTQHIKQLMCENSIENTLINDSKGKRLRCWFGTPSDPQRLRRVFHGCPTFHASHRGFWLHKPRDPKFCTKTMVLLVGVHPHRKTASNRRDLRDCNHH